MSAYLRSTQTPSRLPSRARPGIVGLLLASLPAASASAARLQFQPYLFPNQVVAGASRTMSFCLSNLGGRNQLRHSGEDDDHFVLHIPIGPSGTGLEMSGDGVACVAAESGWSCEIEVKLPWLDVRVGPAGAALELEANASACFALSGFKFSPAPGLAVSKVEQYVGGRRARRLMGERLAVLKTTQGVMSHGDLADVLPDQHHPRTTSFSELGGTANDAQIPNDITVDFAARADEARRLGGIATATLTTSPELEQLRVRVANLEGLLQHVKRQGNEVYISGANLHLVNGLGKTDSTNGLGNLIVGYNEVAATADSGPARTGSHMVVVGSRNDYTSFGGLVVGHGNRATGTWSSAVGGTENVASGAEATVCGGAHNQAAGSAAAVSGGEYNLATGTAAAVSGGYGNEAKGDRSAVSGGQENVAGGTYASVSGGHGNDASGPRYSWIGGGASNRALAIGATVVGGRENVASGDYATVSGQCSQKVTERCVAVPN